MLSTDSAADIKWMAQALVLAQRGRYTTAPNPQVGALVVSAEQQVVGEGWHQWAGEPHAEVLALHQAGKLAQGATLYVTLEPCCHQGRTPPCCQAIIKAGIKQVVVAMLDPNPLVAGKGISWLKQAGIKVRLGLLEKEARRLNPGFIKRMAQGLPRLRAKMAMGLDGRSAMADGTSQWITGPAARADGQRLRAGSGAIVFGIGSVLQDNPQMNLRCDWAGLYTQQPELMLDRPVPQPLRVLLDSRLRLPLTAALLNNSAPLLIVTAQPDKDKQVQLAHQGIDVISLANTNGQVDLRPLLQLLAQRQINEVLLEAGPTLTGAFLAQGLVDELVVYWAPKLMGSKAKPAFELPLERLSQSIGLDIQEVRAVGADWRIKARPRLQEHS